MRSTRKLAPRRRCAGPTAAARDVAGRIRAATHEVLESRRLMCADHYLGGLVPTFDPLNPTAIDVIDTKITVKTGGEFQPITAEAQEAAPGMPALDSRPGAPTAIFLDFDGDTVSSTTAYNDDADATTFNAAEAAIITKAWQEMSEYFAPFDVKVTTTQPAAGFPTAWVAIGNNISGGYSYVNVFPNSASGGAKSWNNSSHARTRVSGIAHEIGHNFGLQHQSDYNSLGERTNEYSSGYDLLHGPIIGVDYAQNVHKWFIGHATTSNSALQDDVTIIANKIKTYQPAGGDGLRVDDFANTIASATALTLSGMAQATEGVIERLSDADAFSFTVDSAAMPTAISAQPHGASGVDLKLSLYNSDGSLIAVRDSSGGGGSNAADLRVLLQPGTYYAVVAGHGNYGDIGWYDLGVNRLPDGWAQADVGPFGANNSSISYDAGTGAFTIGSASALMGSTSPDYVRLTYQTLTGDGSITAKLDSLTSPTSNARAGIILRETFDTNSRYVTAEWANNSQVRSDGRTTTGGTGSVNVVSGIAAPVWLRITRVGNSIAALRSTDGVGWTTINTRTIAMGSTVIVGMFANANYSNGNAQAVFSNVALTGNTAPVTPIYNTLSTPAGLAVGLPATGTGLNISWSDGEGETGYLLERSTDGVTFTTAADLGANVSSFTDTGLPGSLRYFYRVSAKDAAGRSAPASAVSAINRPSSVTNLKFMSVSTTHVVIDWRDTDNESGYRVERSADGGVNWATLTTTAANVPSYSSTGLTQGVTYQFRITPTSALGDGVANTISVQSRLGSVSGVAFTSVQPTQIKLAWTGGVAFATGYRIERSTNGTTFSSIGTVGSSVTSFTDSAVAAMSKYFYRVIATNALTQSVSATVLKAATPSATPLPTGWISLDIGAVAPGASAFSGSTATVIGAGSMNSGTSSSDTIQFLFQRTSGDGDVIARVASHETTTSAVGASLVLRAGLGTNSNYAALRITSGGIDLITRGGTVSNTHATLTAPIWLKLTRSGTSVSGYYSTDGVAWTLVGTSSGAVPAGNAFVGLTTTPQDSTSLVKATFDNLSGSLLNQSDTTAPGAPIFTGISTDTGIFNADRITSDNTLVIAGVAEAGSFVTISRTDLGVIGTVKANYLGNFSFDYTGTTLADGQYTFTAAATDASNNLGATSNSFAVTIDTVAPTPALWNFNPATQLLEVTYAEDLLASTVATADMAFANLSIPSSPPTDSASYAAATRTATYGVSPASLADGHWRATLNSGAVTDLAGNLSGAATSFEYFYAAGTADADTFIVRLAAGGAAIEVVEGGAITTVPRAQLRQIVLNPLGGSDAVHLDFSAGDWMPPQGVALGAAENVRITGATGQPNFTFAGTVLSRGAWNIDLTTAQALAFAGGEFVVDSDLGGRALIADAGATLDVRTTTRPASLSITGGATVNLNDNDLVIPSGSLAAIETLIADGLLVSDDAGDNSTTTLGVASAGALLGLSGDTQSALFAGQTVFASDVIVKYTYAGDANLDGLVSGDDYSAIDFNIAVPAADGWLNGDFNHDGVISGDDYSLIDFNIIAQSAPL
jgi:regulation of enolase protein 1 (concanavalin A-like superfamily)